MSLTKYFNRMLLLLSKADQKLILWIKPTVKIGPLHPKGLALNSHLLILILTEQITKLWTRCHLRRDLHLVAILVVVLATTYLLPTTYHPILDVCAWASNKQLPSTVSSYLPVDVLAFLRSLFCSEYVPEEARREPDDSMQDAETDFNDEDETSSASKEEESEADDAATWRCGEEFSDWRSARFKLEWSDDGDR